MRGDAGESGWTFRRRIYILKDRPEVNVGPRNRDNRVPGAKDESRRAFDRVTAVRRENQRENVILAPHIASASVETRTKMAAMAAENVIALFHGRRPPNALNPEVLGS